MTVMVNPRLMRMEQGYDQDQLPPLVVMEPPPAESVSAMEQSHSTHRSIETLVVVLAVITIVAVIAGFIARLCGGRHYGGNGGDHDVEGWIDSKCRSCIDSGISTPPPPPPPPPPPAPPAPQPAAAAAEAVPKEEATPTKEEEKK